VQRGKLRLPKILLFLFCVVFNLIGCTQKPAAGIVIYGDSQHNPKMQGRLVQTILSFKAAVVFRVGDLVDRGNDQKLWKSFNNIHGKLLRTTEYFPALGNHDTGSELFFENFHSLHNRKWYSIDRQGIHFIVLDSNSKLDLESEQYQWLKDDLSKVKSTARFVIAIFHHPLFDVSLCHEADEKKLKTVLLPLFKHYGVGAVFSGHAHDYQRFEYEGMYFVVTGGGGSDLCGQGRANPYLQKFDLIYHFCFLTPENEFLRVKVISINSKIIDEFRIPARIDLKS
jgi:acid phosphatase type 7